MHPELERLDDPIPFGECLGPAVDALAIAYRRIGHPGRERQPIPPELRRLVFMRDQFACKWCGRLVQPRHHRAIVDDEEGAPFQLDHIVPHAAGGCDHAHNLRVLCRACNELRSNRATDQYARAIPVTLQCTPCLIGSVNAHMAAVDWDAEDFHIDHTTRITAYCGSCRLGSWVNDEGLLL